MKCLFCKDCFSELFYRKFILIGMLFGSLPIFILSTFLSFISILGNLFK